MEEAQRVDPKSTVKGLDEEQMKMHLQQVMVTKKIPEMGVTEQD
jgi:hypothetical protein